MSLESLTDNQVRRFFDLLSGVHNELQNELGDSDSMTTELYYLRTELEKEFTDRELISTKDYAHPFDDLSHTSQHKVMTAYRQVSSAIPNLRYFGVLCDTFVHEIKELEEIKERLAEYISLGTHKRIKVREGEDP